MSRCGACGEPGHYRPTCPKKPAPAPALPPPIPSEVAQSPLASILPIRQPAPEPVPPTLTEWQSPPPGSDPKLLEVRLDQHGRVRARINALSNDWVSWEVLDCTGQRVGKPGFDGKIEVGRNRVDAKLVDLMWLSPATAVRPVPHPIDPVMAEGLAGAPAPVVLHPASVLSLQHAAEKLLRSKAKDQTRQARSLALLVVGALSGGQPP